MSEQTEPGRRRPERAIETRRGQSLAKRERVLTALATFMADGTPITVTGLAKEADCSREFVYEHFDSQVASAREIQKQQGVPAAGRRSVAPTGLQSDLLNAQQEIARLRQENQTLRTQLRHDLGSRLEMSTARADDRLAEKQQEVERLISERRQLERDVASLRRQVSNLTDELAAERMAHAETARMNIPDEDNVVPIK